MTFVGPYAVTRISSFGEGVVLFIVLIGLYFFISHLQNFLKQKQEAIPEQQLKETYRPILEEKSPAPLGNFPSPIPNSNNGISIDNFASWINHVNPEMGVAKSDFENRNLLFCCDSSNFTIYVASFVKSDVIEYALATGPSEGLNSVHFLAAFAQGEDYKSKVGDVSRITSAASENHEFTMVADLSKTILSNGYYFEPFCNHKNKQLMFIWINKASEIKSKDEVTSLVSLDEYPRTNAILDCSGKMSPINQPPTRNTQGYSHAGYDDRMLDAIDQIYDSGYASISTLQQKMKIGYVRAGRILDSFTSLGIISNSSPREILVDKETALMKVSALPPPPPPILTPEEKLEAKINLYKWLLDDKDIESCKNFLDVDLADEAISQEVYDEWMAKAKQKQNGYKLDTITNGFEFEQYIAQLLLNNGFNSAATTPKSGDQGIDVLAERDGVKYAIQCKLYSQPVGNSAVQETCSGRDFYDCQVGIVATSNYFTNSARELASKNKILLWDRDKILEMEKNSPSVLHP